MYKKSGKKLLLACLIFLCLVGIAIILVMSVNWFKKWRLERQLSDSAAQYYADEMTDDLESLIGACILGQGHGRIILTSC